MTICVASRILHFSPPSRAMSTYNFSISWSVQPAQDSDHDTVKDRRNLSVKKDYDNVFFMDVGE